MNHTKLIAAAAFVTATVAVNVAIRVVSADTPPSSLVAITPCRLLDTRAGSTVGDHPGPLQAGEVATLTVTGPHGLCNIEEGTTAITATATISSPTGQSWLTIYPGDAAGSPSSNINWVPGQPPTANMFTVGLSPTGQINVFNAFGTVDVIIDINGVHQSLADLAPTTGSWGVQNRNMRGSAVADLRSGPFFGPSDPPEGTGSLNFSVATGERVAFGNEVDFVFDDFSAVTDLGFHVFNTQENLNEGPAAMPNISIELNPNMSNPPATFTTASFSPNNSLPGIWSQYIDATASGLWGLTGAAFAGTLCDINGARCTWDQLQGFLNDGGDPPQILSVAVSKGTDQQWHGAVDALRVNDTIYDFEEFGVFLVTAL